MTKYNIVDIMFAIRNFIKSLSVVEIQYILHNISKIEFINNIKSLNCIAIQFEDNYVTIHNNGKLWEKHPKFDLNFSIEK